MPKFVPDYVPACVNALSTQPLREELMVGRSDSLWQAHNPRYTADRRKTQWNVSTNLGRSNRSRWDAIDDYNARHCRFPQCRSMFRLPHPRRRALNRHRR